MTPAECREYLLTRFSTLPRERVLDAAGRCEGVLGRAVAWLEGGGEEEERIREAASRLASLLKDGGEGELLEYCVGLEKWDRDALSGLMDETVQQLRDGLLRGDAPGRSLRLIGHIQVLKEALSFHVGGRPYCRLALCGSLCACLNRSQSKEIRGTPMTEIIGVRFKSGGKQYYFDPKGIQVEPGQGVIVETAKGIEYGECLKGNTMVEDEAVVAPLRPCFGWPRRRMSGPWPGTGRREERAFHICQEKIAEHKLDMKLVEVEYNFEGTRYCSSLPQRAGWTSGPWSKIWLVFFTPVSNSARSVCVTRPRCWGAWGSVESPFAVPLSWMSSSPCPSRWRKRRICPLIPRRYQVPVDA